MRGIAELLDDHYVLITPLAIKVAPQTTLLHEARAFQHMLRAVVIVEYVDAQLAEIHFVERETDQSLDGIAAEAAVPRRRLADEEAEPGSLRNPVDVVDGCVPNVRAVIAPLDGEMALGEAGVHRSFEPFDLVLKRDRIARLQRPDDVRIVDPAIAALGVVALERAQDDVLARDHEAPPRGLRSALRKITLGAVGHWGRL